MAHLEGIRGFLAAVRRRLLVRAGLEAVGWGAAVLGVLVLSMALVAAAVGPAGFWPTLTGFTIVVVLLVALGWGLGRPAFRLRTDLAAARRAGDLLPAAAGATAPATMASDLVSILELTGSAPPTSPGTISPGLVGAFGDQVARGLSSVEPRRLVSFRPAARALGAAGIAAAMLGAAALLWPLAGRGLRTLLHRPSRFEGSVVSSAALVGDVRLTYQYPAYTGLAPRVVEGSTGDASAVKGTRVRIETRPLRPARHALLLLGEGGEKGEIETKLVEGTLTAEVTLNEDASYRFWLEPPFGRPVREARSHHLTAEPDAPPRVEISGPADRLELPTPRPIEIGYSASDDFGLGAVDLVVRVGDRPEQRVPLRDGSGARAIQGRTVWDPTTVGLAGAERIAYRIEARDRDAVSGAKVSSSRTLYLIVQNPHEGLEERLERQRELHEKLIGDLAERLEHGPPSVAPFSPAADATAMAERFSAFASVHESEEAHLALLGQLIDADRREGGMGKALRGALAGIADRLERVLRDETQALGAIKGKTPAAALARLDALAPKHVGELENDVLLLDDLIGRQRLEDLASLGKELTDAHQRLQDLLERYKKTKDPGLRRQLEREARDLRARISELAQRIAEVKSRNDVPEEWRNLPDTKQLADEARKLDDMLQKGDDADLEKALAQLGDELRSMRKMLDQNAEGFGAERFPQENRVVADLMKRIGDLEGDERTLQKETQGIADRQQAEMEKRLRGELDQMLKREAEKAERLKQRLGGLQTGNPESGLSEEVDRARESAKQIRRLLAERDLAEAKGEAERAAASLDRAGENLSELSEARRNHRPAGEADRDKAGEAVSDARRMAQEIADDLAKIMPRPSDVMSPEEREAARGQSERQGSIGKRTDDIAGEASKRLGKMPGMEKAESELRGAAARMKQAADMLKRDESKGAAAAERDAADRLSKLRDSMQERQMGGSRQSHEPVRIPGADESTAPRAWRQELLDAMKERAPERFRDEVRRYYEELVK